MAKAIVMDAPYEDDRVVLAQERRKILGKLAEFELALNELPPRAQNFALAYLEDPTNGRRAAIKAGCPEKAAHVQAHRMLNDPRVAAAIALGESVREDRTHLTTDRTLHELALIAFSDINNFVLTGRSVAVKEGVPEYVTRAIQSVEFDVMEGEDEEGRAFTRTKVRLKLWSKTDALRMLAVYQKLMSGEGGTNIMIAQANIQHNTWAVGDKKITF